jgi:hypothetical protein
MWWFTPVILANWEVEIGGSWLEVSPSKKFNKTLAQ